MNSDDFRWQQRYKNFCKVFAVLDEAVLLFKERPLNKLEEQGVIQRFEFTHELAWNVIKDYFEYQGNTSITGSRDATRAAFSQGLIADGEGWMEMIKSRNQSSHTYNEEIANDIFQKIVELYHPLFVAFQIKMNSLIQ